MDELRHELGEERVELSELVILGAEEKVARLRAQRSDVAQRRSALADRVRRGDVAPDRAAADAVRRAGWART